MFSETNCTSVASEKYIGMPLILKKTDHLLIKYGYLQECFTELI